jgi:hypothetical protein
MHSDTYEALAQRCERGAGTLEHEADNAAEVLADRGYPGADAEKWAADKRNAARAAREYATDLRAEAGDRPTGRPEPSRLAQAERVASASELGGILIDGRPLDEARAQSDSVLDADARKAWEEGTSYSQQKASEIEATGKFTHVDETIGGVKQVPFWQLGQPTDESTSQQHAERTDRDGDEF